jgi:hypothetical protein
MGVEETARSVRPELRAAEDPNSPKARARALRRKLAGEKELTLVVPGYESLLGVRYHPIPESEWRDVASKIGNVDDANGLEIAIDVMIAACDAIVWRDEPVGDFTVVTDDDDQPIRFDVRLAEWLGFEAQTAREVVREVFSPEGSKPVSPSVHGDAVAEWMRGNDASINRALLGK